MLPGILKANSTEWGQTTCTAAFGVGYIGIERGMAVNKCCSHYCCSKQTSLPYDIGIYHEKLMAGGEKTKLTFN